MPTFEQLLNAKLAPLDTAATQWTEMITKLTELQTDAKAMKSKADKATWKGENATVTKEFVTKSAKEFSDAVIEATSVRDLIKDAHALLKTAQRDLKDAYENPPPGITIYPDGVLSHRVHPDRRSADNTDPIATEAQFDALRGKLEGILKRANEADELCAWGLRALIKYHPNDFGSASLSGVADAKKMRAEEKQQTEDGREAAKLYARWETLGDKERERLLKLAEDGKDSPAFAAALMQNLSYHGRDQQEAVLLLAGSLDDSGNGQVSATEARLYKALSGSLATATGPDSPIGTPGGTPSAWTKQLITMARDGNGLPDRHPGALKGGISGWNALTHLMAADAGDRTYDPDAEAAAAREEGDKHKRTSPWDKDKGDPVYSEAFLTEVADSIRDWETHDKNAYSDDYMKSWVGTQSDPMKGLLNAMSRNPSASTHYFDPNTTDNLKYFMDDRHWPGADVESKMEDPKTQYTSARAEFGAALEAAATGRAPGTPLNPVGTHHDGAQAAIFERMVNEYAEVTKTDKSAVPVPLRMAMGDMIGDYASDVHQIFGKDMDGHTQFSDLSIDRGALTRVIRSSAEDPNAFGVIHASQTAVIAEGMERFSADAYRNRGEESDELEAWLKQSGQVLGHLDTARADVIYDLGQAEKDTIAWNKMMNYHVYGAPLTPIPVVGDIAQRAVDAGTAAYMNDLTSKVDAETRKDLINHFNDGERELKAMMKKTALGRGLALEELDKSPGVYEDVLQTAAQQGYHGGITDANLKMKGQAG
ncbi:DUF6571 family protein [Streptomyces sp. CB01580]|uniref:DUF6571 family protein n=1 Tax=Streptomyces sp. CB01580 TaxID=1703933 RepID=UPI00093D8ABF|nr:DUF6571 family protein [Streptomyces sp. CB01580]OKJ37280.1 hypothetical protein AMK22_14430 [Streptomyces sp. CB01580]